MEKFEVEVDDQVLYATHNMPCAVCWENKAILLMNQYVFEPCGDCQQAGWELRKKKWWNR